MKNFIHPNIPNLIMMVRPRNFGFNEQTAASNSFQNRTDDQVAEVALKEFDEAVDVFRSKGIQVKVFEDQDEILPDAIFPNNWISHIPGSSIVIYPMLTENRKAEVREDIVEWAEVTLDVKERVDLRPDGRILEGTGSIVFDHNSKMAFAAISPRTDLGLLKKLCDNIGYTTVSFEAVDLQGNQIYHTNVVMSIGSEIAIICLESISNLIERAMIKSHLEQIGKKVIDISYSQMNNFAGNALEVQNSSGKSFYVMSTTAFNSLNVNQIKDIESHSEIIQIKIPSIEKIGGGSIRCMMAGFFLS